MCWEQTGTFGYARNQVICKYCLRLRYLNQCWRLGNNLYWHLNQYTLFSLNKIHKNDVCKLAVVAAKECLRPAIRNKKAKSLDPRGKAVREEVEEAYRAYLSEGKSEASLFCGLVCLFAIIYKHTSMKCSTTFKISNQSKQQLIHNTHKLTYIMANGS